MSIWRDINLGMLNVATFWGVLNTIAVGAFIVVAFSEAREKVGTADRTDIDVASATIDDEAPALLGLAEITKARQQVQLLATAPADQATDLLEAAPAKAAAPSDSTAPSDPPKRAVDSSDAN